MFSDFLAATAIPRHALYYGARRGGAPWARAANFVKKPRLIVNVTYLELNIFNASMWLEVHQTPKSHNALIDVFKFIRYIQINTSGTITSSLRFLYIFDQSGLLCGAGNWQQRAHHIMYYLPTQI